MNITKSCDLTNEDIQIAMRINGGRRLPGLYSVAAKTDKETMATGPNPMAPLFGYNRNETRNEKVLRMANSI